MNFAATTAAPERARRTSVEKIARAFTRDAVLRALNRGASALDARPLLCLALVLACFLPTALLEAHAHYLTNDEIYTVHIAQAPTLGRMLALSREIDLHPPLHYLLQRAALHLPFPRWLDSRLPSLLAGIVACFATLRFTARRLGPLFGLVAAVILLFSPLLEFSWSNRPYMLWLAFLCLLLSARRSAVQPGRSLWSVLLVFLLSLGMVMSHLIGVLCLGPFLLAELVRARQHRRLDWPMLLALGVPAIVALGFRYQLAHLSKDAFPLTQMPSFSLALETYVSNCGTPMQILGVLLLVFLLLVGPLTVARVRESAPQTSLPFDVPEFVILGGLILLPLATLFAGAVLHIQFWTRYGAAALPAIAVLGAALIACRLPFARSFAFLIVLSGFGYAMYLNITDTGPQSNAGIVRDGRSPIPLRALNPDLPIVAASPMTFIEMSDRETPDIASRVYYLTDVDSALRYSHYTLFENEDKIRSLLQLRSHAESLSGFLPQHHRFYVVGDYGAPQIWLLRCLADKGMTLAYLGKYASSYESQDLYLVSY